eukprot:g5340.t1
MSGVPPGTLVGSNKYQRMTEKQKIDELNRLIERWREPSLADVRPCFVVPDTTNREHTGLSAGHVHYVATQMGTGFTARDADGGGHDMPVVIRETAASELGRLSLRKWHRAVESNAHFPPLHPRLRAAFDAIDDPRAEQPAFFCSLGNGHFFQALNCFGNETTRMFGAEEPPPLPPAAAAAPAAVAAASDGASRSAASAASPPLRTALEVAALPSRYVVGADAALRRALDVGVRAIVLRAGIPKAERKFVSLMLNSTFEYRWSVGADGRVTVDSGDEFRRFTSFDGLTKHADSHQLDEIIELKLRREAEKRRKAAALKAILEERARARKAALQIKSNL